MRWERLQLVVLLYGLLTQSQASAQQTRCDAMRLRKLVSPHILPRVLALLLDPDLRLAALGSCGTLALVG